MEQYSNLLVASTEFISNRLYLGVFKNDILPLSTHAVHYFCIDEEFVYENFFNDFGPLNICMLYRYCQKLNRKLSSNLHVKKKIVHYTTIDGAKRLNSAFLIGSYAILYLKMTPGEVFSLLNCGPAYTEFCDASYGSMSYTITLQDCLYALDKAHMEGFFDFDDFDAEEYEYYERVEYGDLNWIIPGKFLAFCGPHSRTRTDNGYPCHAPETYFSYFRQNGVTTVIRLNLKLYNASRFSNAGFQHQELFFTDGSKPKDQILKKFLQICEGTTGAIAVHCKAGLGRTGSLIGAYLMKHYRFTAREAIAWLRLCRPGSVIGHQQEWMEEKQEQLWAQGLLHYKSISGRPISHQFGIYSSRRRDAEKAKNIFNENNSIGHQSSQSKFKDRVRNISHKVDSMNINDNSSVQLNDSLDTSENDDEDESIDMNIATEHIRSTNDILVDPDDNIIYNKSDKTQGDTLNQIKALRSKRSKLVQEQRPQCPAPPANSAYTSSYTLQKHVARIESGSGGHSTKCADTLPNIRQTRMSKPFPEALGRSTTSEHSTTAIPQTSRSSKEITKKRFIEPSRGLCPSEINQPLNDSIALERRNVNNNNTISREDKNVQNKPIRLTHRCINSVGCIKMRNIACNYSNHDKKDTKAKTLQRNKPALREGTSTVCLKLRANPRRMIPIVREEVKKSNTSSGGLILNSPVNIAQVLCSNVESNTNNKLYAGDKNANIPVLDNISSNLLRRGKRSLSSTRLKREKSADNNTMKLQRKHTTVRSLPGAYSSTTGMEAEKCSQFLTEPLTNKKHMINKEHQTKNEYSSPVCRSHVKISSTKNDLAPTQIVLRIRKR